MAFGMANYQASCMAAIVASTACLLLVWMCDTVQRCFRLHVVLCWHGCDVCLSGEDACMACTKHVAM